VYRLEFRCQHQYASGFQIDVNFETQHLVTSLFGPSGSGKTSILEMIAGLKPPQQGRIHLNGHTLFDHQQHLSIPLQKRRVGMVFQDHLLFPHYSVENNLRYGLKRRQTKHASITLERVTQVLDLQKILQQYPSSISGGERQRVALGRALLSQPELLMMDEPLTALDEILKNRILAYLERVVQEWKIPTLLVSHAQLEVHRLSDWVIVLDQGRIINQGTPTEALSHPYTMSLTDGVGPINLLRIEEVECHEGICMGRISDQYLHLPSIEDHPEDHLPAPLFVEFSPESVILSRHDVENISVRNHLHGSVCKIMKIGNIYFVSVDVGQIFWAKVTRQAIEELEIREGDTVTCLIKTHSLHVVE